MKTLNLTKAEIFATAWGDQGDQFENAQGKWIVDVLAKITKEEFGTGDNIECARYVFDDDSAIVVGPGAWDVEGDEPFDMDSI